MPHASLVRATRYRSGSSRGPVAFTLVELLVVIGIIAVLLAILLPSLSRARQAAMQVACLSNLRQIGLAFMQYADNNRNFYPVAYNPDGNSYNTCEKYELEVMLSPYIGEPLTIEHAYANVRVGGGIWICPAAPVTTGPHPNYPSAKMYLWENEDGDHLRSNCYAGLWYHYRTDHSFRPPQSTTGPTWRRTYFRGHESAAPLQWCSVRLTPGNDNRGLAARSWHYPNGRPTLFVDGHAAVLNNPYYKGDFQHILSANAEPLNVHAWVQPYGSDWLYSASKYEVSEY